MRSLQKASFYPQCQPALPCSDTGLTLGSSHPEGSHQGTRWEGRHSPSGCSGGQGGFSCRNGIFHHVSLNRKWPQLWGWDHTFLLQYFKCLPFFDLHHSPNSSLTFNNWDTISEWSIFYHKVASALNVVLQLVSDAKQFKWSSSEIIYSISK